MQKITTSPILTLSVCLVVGLAVAILIAFATHSLAVTLMFGAMASLVTLALLSEEAKKQL